MRALLTLALASAALTARADEITLRDGRRVMGTMTLEPTGRLHFTSADRSAIALDRVQSIHFTANAPPFRAGVVHQVHLIGEQRLTGELLTLDDKTLTIRTAWRDRLVVPRGAVLGVTNLPGTSIVCDEDFENGLKAWKVTGAAHLTDKLHTSGTHSLLLDGVGQLVTHTLPAPVESGSAGVNCYLPDTTTGARWQVEAEFQGTAGHRVVRTTLADDTEDYAVEAPAPADEKGRIKRQPGWHRLAVEFSSGRLLVTVDDVVLWYSREKGPGGPLREVRLMCVAGKGAVRGAVAFDEFTVTRAIEVLRRPVDTTAQDEAWLATGDQLFGRLTSLDRHGLELENRLAKRRYSWGEVRGAFPQRPGLTPTTSDGAHMRVWLRPARGTEPDELVGVVRAFDERHLTLRHPALGDLEIDRGRLLRLRPLFHGKRIELDNGARLLGEKGQRESGVQPSQAEGPSVDYRLRLEERPERARLVLTLRPIRGRAEVVVNGRVVAELATSVALPRDSLKAGDNIITVRVREEGGRRGSCLISEVAVELPE